MVKRKTKRKSPKGKSAKQKKVQASFKANIAKAKKMFRKKGNTKSWKTCVKEAFRK